MSLNSIQLSGIQVAELYPESLVLTGESVPGINKSLPEINEPTPAIKEPAQVNGTIQYLGKNQQQLVILVSYPNDVHLSDQSLEFLTAVLKACQLTLADVAILNLARQQADLTRIIQELNPRILIAFGISNLPSEIPDSPEVLSPANVAGLKYMAAPALDELNQTTEAVKPLKRRLWESMKAMLGI